jgi:hypothetical protein
LSNSTKNLKSFRHIYWDQIKLFGGKCRSSNLIGLFLYEGKTILTQALCDEEISKYFEVKAKKNIQIR